MNDNRNELEALQEILRCSKQLAVDGAQLAFHAEQLHDRVAERYLRLRDQQEPETGANKRAVLQSLIRAVKQVACDAAPLRDRELSGQIRDLHSAIADRLKEQPQDQGGIDTIGEASSGVASALAWTKPAGKENAP